MNQHMSVRHPTIPSGILLVILGVVAAIGISAVPAHAATSVSVRVGNGVVGVDQTVTATVSANDTSGEMSLLVGGSMVAFQVMEAGTLSASFTWKPSKSGSAAISASFSNESGTSTSGTTTVSIAKVATKTQVTVPDAASPDGTVQVSATVTAERGDYVPTGTVYFLNGSGAVLKKDSLDSRGRAVADIQVPKGLSTLSVVADYRGDANATGSRSAAGRIKIVKSATQMKLVVPATVTSGSVFDLVAEITPAITGGTVVFAVGTLSNASTPKSVVQGVARAKWKLTRAGTLTVYARFSGFGDAPATSTTARVTVVAQAKPDVITLTPSGSATPWAKESMVTLTNGADVSLLAAATSGAAVTLAVEGPCSLVNGTTLHIDGVGGTCRVVASSPGGNGYAGSREDYSVATAAGAQTATVDPPKDATYKPGKVLKLARVSARTNVGQAIRWKVTSSPKACRISRAAGWSIVVMKAKGRCAVSGTAPGIGDQWSPFEVMRTYTVRR